MINNQCLIVFVLALKSQRVSKDWQRVTKLFTASIGSIVGQTNTAWRAIVVGHEKPVCRHFDDPRVKFESVEFPPPVRIDYDLGTADKSKKMAIGVRLAKEYQPTFLMIMDADDLISSRITDLASRYSDTNGWIIKQGYNYYFGSRWIQRNNQFNCGTNAIVNTRYISYPDGKDPEADDENCIILKAGHVYIERAMRELGHPLEVLPFRGVVYTTGHGDNATDIGPWDGKGRKGPRWLMQTITSYQPLTPRVIREFGLSTLLDSTQQPT